MFATSGIESGSTLRAGVATGLIFCDCQFRATDSTKDSFGIKFSLRPNFWFVIRLFFMTGKARIVLLTALELDCNHIQIRVPMLTSSLIVHRLSVYINAFDLRSYDRQ